MEKMTDYLKKWREVMPSWLANYRPGDHVEFSDFMGGRIGYYPGSFFDGCLIKTANKAHCLHAFLYVDYGVTREEVEEELGKENALLGYHSIGRVEWPFKDIMPHGFFHIPSEYTPMINKRLMLVEEGVKPFCIMEAYERNNDRDDESLSYYENGKRSPDIQMLLLLSDYFNVSIDYLIRGEEFAKK